MKKTIKKLSTMLLSFAMVVNLSPASKMALFAGETETDKPAATESAETEAPKETEKPSAKETAKPTEKPSEEAAKPAEKDEEPVAETTKETPKPEAETSKETEASKETDESATETPDEPEEPAAKDPDETEVPEEPEGSDADIPEETEEPADKAPVESDKPEADEPKTDAGSKRAPDESDAEDAKNWEYAEINNVKITNGILTWDPDASATDYYLSIDQDDNYAYCYFDAPANSYNIKKQIDIWIKSSQIKKPKNNIYTYVLWEYRSGMTARHEGTYSYKSSAKPYKIGKISLRTPEGRLQQPKHVFLWTVLGSSAGMMFNVIAEPVVSYFYKRYILGVDAEASAILAKLQSLTTFVNAILSVIIAVALYAALRPAMIRTGLFDYNIGFKAKSKKQ